MSARGVQKIPLSVKSKRNSVKCLSTLELMKLRKNNEIKVSKGKILLFGRRMNEISSGGVKALHDRQIWRRDVYVNPSIPSDFVGLTNWVYSSYKR
jgi:hypothetical protein